MSYVSFDRSIKTSVSTTPEQSECVCYPPLFLIINPLANKAPIFWLFIESIYRLTEERPFATPLLTDEEDRDANSHQCEWDRVLSLVCSILHLRYSWANTRLCSLTFFVQAHSLTGLTADCFLSHFMLRSAAQCAKGPNPPTHTPLLNQLSSGTDEAPFVGFFWKHVQQNVS